LTIGRAYKALNPHHAAINLIIANVNARLYI
jgi:hypothetical protein